MHIGISQEAIPCLSEYLLGTYIVIRMSRRGGIVLTIKIRSIILVSGPYLPTYPPHTFRRGRKIYTLRMKHQDLRT